MAGTFLENNDFEVVAVPINTTGAAVAGDYICLSKADEVTFVICQGAWAGGTPAVTLVQAQDVAATGAKALAFTRYKSKVALTGTTWAGASYTTVSANTFNLGTTANTMTAITVTSSDLDVANGFNCVSLAIASPGSNNDLICVVALITRCRNLPPQDAKTDATS